ncbi:3750_t:CDS:1, partial [Gigaspora margarita]
FTLRSGGQTGVDLGMLDAALNYVKNNPKVISKEYEEENSLLSVKFINGFVWKITGWCPKGRKAKDGKIDPKYPLQETPTSEYKERMEWNVHDANATLILLLLSAKPELDGTSFTIEMAKKHEKELKLIYLDTNTREKNAKEAFG